MNTLEAIAAVLTLINIALVALRSVWNFPFALVAVSLTSIVLWQSKLYSDALLQGFFFAVNLYGWWAWRRNAESAGEVVVETMTPPGLMAWALGSIIATGLWGFVMGRLTDAVNPYPDAAVLILSMAGQILLTQRRLENWYWWILVNMISIWLYHVRNLDWFRALYVVCLGLAIWGLMSWRRRLMAMRR